MTGTYVKTNVIGAIASHTSEEGAHIPSWPTGLVIIIINTNNADQHGAKLPEGCEGRCYAKLRV